MNVALFGRGKWCTCETCGIVSWRPEETDVFHCRTCQHRERGREPMTYIICKRCGVATAYTKAESALDETGFFCAMCWRERERALDRYADTH